MDDPCWETCFTTSQLEEIKAAKKEALCSYDEPYKEMFKKLHSVVKEFRSRKFEESSPSSSSSKPLPTTDTANEEYLIDMLFKEVTRHGLINPRQNYDMYWIQKTMLEILDSYRYKIFEWVKSKGSEMDLVTRVWTMLDKVFDDMMVETKR